MSKNRKKKTEKIGKLNPNLIKSRDILHMQEFLSGKGGPHRDKRKDRQRKHKHNTSDPEAQGDG